MKGKVLAINTGSTSTKVGYYVDGNTVLVRNLELSAQEVIRFDSVLEQGPLRREIVMDFLREAGVGLGDIDIIMARGGLFAPAVTGVYGVNADMREVLLSGRDGVHACNLSAVDGLPPGARHRRSRLHGLCRRPADGGRNAPGVPRGRPP